MPSQLAWLDHDAEASERTLRILAFFQQKESREELGLGSVRDGLADHLFPGTSTIQTRLRYMFFIPWVYKSLEDARVPADRFGTEADRMERGLIEPLLQSGDHDGIVGRNVGTAVKRLPSSVYWAGLGSWGIRKKPHSQGTYHRTIDATYRHRDGLIRLERSAREREDDTEKGQLADTYNWHPRLPPQPPGFPDEASFALTRDEAEFIMECLQSRHRDSLLAFLAQECKPTVGNMPWEHPDYEKLSDDHRKLLTQARLFSELMHGAALLYNIQLAELREHRGLLDRHQGSFHGWVDETDWEEMRSWELDLLWQQARHPTYRITPQTKSFVERWRSLACASPHTLLHSEEARELVRRREQHLKGPHSRFRNRRALEQWGGQSGVGRLTYRWTNVKMLLKDLRQGMGEG